MNTKKLLLLATASMLVSTLFSQTEATTNGGKKVLLYEDGTWLYADSVPLYNVKAVAIKRLEIPKLNGKDLPVSHLGYTFLYNEDHEQASWVAYELTNEETSKTVERTDKFLPDPSVKTGTANNNDYLNSGYDRGHLAPAADMGWSETAMAESFYYSNMSPQQPSFNRGIWKKLEELVRTWAVEYTSLYIVTGPVLKPGLPSIGANKVSVPKYYYKVILDYTEPELKAIGFIMPNENIDHAIYDYAVSIDSVEKFTGIDFFPSLPDGQEKIIEATRCIPCWTWGTSSPATNPKPIENKPTGPATHTPTNDVTSPVQKVH